MSTTLALTISLVACAAVALAASVYLAVRPGPSAPGRLRPLAWHLVRGGLVAACAGTGAGLVLTVVSLHPA